MERIEKITALVRQLQEVEQELQALTGGELDSVAIGGGTPLLRHEAQQQLRTSEKTLRELTSLQAGILDALPARIAVLNQTGKIIAVNAAWKAAARADGGARPGFGLGDNHRAWLTPEGGAMTIRGGLHPAEAIRRVLEGQTTSECVEYPDPFSASRGWTRLNVLPIGPDPGHGVVVMYLDITESKGAELRLARQNRLYLFLGRVNEVISQAEDASQLLNEVCEIATRQGRYQGAALVQKNGRDGSFAVLAASGITAEEWRRHSPIIEQLANGRSYVCNDAESDAGPPAPFLGSWALFSVPFSSTDALVLAIADGQSEAFQEDALPVLEAMTNDIAFALRSLQRKEAQLLAESALRKSENRFRELFEQAAVGLCVLSPALAFQRANRSLLEILGRQPEDAHEIDELVITHPADREQEIKLTRQVVSGEVPSVTWEKRYLRPSGEAVWCQQTISVLRTGVGDGVELLAVVRDISEQKAAQQQIREMDDLLVSAQRVGRMGIWSMNVATGHLFWSEATYELFGLPPDNSPLPYDEFRRFILDEDNPGIDAALREVGPTKPAFEVSYRIRRPDGSIRLLYERGKVEFDPDGKELRRLGVVTDLTDRKRAEIERDRLFELSLDLLSVASTDGRLKQVNPAWTACLGWSAEELTAGPMDRFILAEDHAATHAVRAQIVQGNPARGFENRYRCKHGGFRWLSWSVHPMVEMHEVFGVARDVTERKQAEFEAAHAAALLAGAVRIQQEIASSTLPRPELLQLAAARFADLYGALAVHIEMIQQGIRVTMAEAGIMSGRSGCRAQLTEAFAQQVLTSGQAFLTDESEPEPKVDWLACRKFGVRTLAAAPITGPKAALGVVIICFGERSGLRERDLPNLQILAEILGSALQRLEATEQLRGSEAQYKLLFRSNPNPMWTYDAKTLRFLAVNEQAIERYGYSEAEFLGMSIDQIRPPEEIDRLKREINFSGKRFGQWRHRTKAGAFLDVEISSDDIIFNGQAARLVLAHDVSERERAARALRASVEEFQILAESMPQIVWIADGAGNHTYHNQNWFAFTGLTGAESQGSGWLRVVHPDDEPETRAQWETAVATGADFSVECRLRRGDGAYHWWLIRGLSLREAGGRTIKWFGTCTDIQSLKVAQNEIRQVNRSLKLLSRCNELLVRATSEAELLHGICQLAVDEGGYSMAWIGFAAMNPGRDVQPVASAGNDGGYLSEISVSWSEDSPFGQGPAGRAIRSGEPVLSRDFAIDPTFAPFWEAARKRGYRSNTALPLKDGLRTIGVMVLMSDRIDESAPWELTLLQEMADDVGFGIITLRQRASQARTQSAINKLAAEVGSSDDFFVELCRHMTQAIGADACFIAHLQVGEPPRLRIRAGVIGEETIREREMPLESVAELELVRLKECIIPQSASDYLPNLGMIGSIQANACVARRLEGASGEPIGLLFVLFSGPIAEEALATAALRIFATRAASEMERQRIDVHVREQSELLDRAHEAIIMADLSDRITYWNKGAERVYGWTAAEVAGREVAAALGVDPAKRRDSLQVLLTKGTWDQETVARGNDGRELIINSRWSLVRDEAGAPRSLLAIDADVTETKKLERQFLRSQRLESLGTLAGGIAHDLNNLLAPIVMGVGLMRRLETRPETLRIVDSIERSAQRGTKLVKQVLSFARGVEGQTIPVDLRQLVHEINNIAENTFPKNVRFQTQLPTDLWLVTGDPTNLSQVLLNLAVNARDAMPNGGILTIEAENVEVDSQYSTMHRELTQGRYVRLQVRDTGEGISKAVIDRIFEPFYTTKEQGKGTGLGLSTVLGIVRSHRGTINVASELGKGSAFTLFLPAGGSDVNAAALPAPIRPLQPGRGELILVVDDESLILEVTQQTLESHGYQVLTANDGAEAVGIFALHRDRIAVVLTDMMMPFMDGPALISALRRLVPTVKVVAASGLCSNFNAGRLQKLGVSRFLAKPYSAPELLRALRETIDQP